MFTRHGHQIPGSPVIEGPPRNVARCGGPVLCTPCSDDVNEYMRNENAPIEEGDTMTTQLNVIEIKEDPNSNSEFVMAGTRSSGWGKIRKTTFLARRGTYKIGDPVQITIALPKKES